MSSVPSTTSGPPSASQQSQPPVPKRSFTLERLAAWVLPLAAVCLLLAALSMAVGSGEMRAWTAGITVYAVCLAMWLTVAALCRTSMAAAPVPTSATSQGLPAAPLPQELTFQTEFQKFAGFANSLFPWLALLVLTGTSFVAAIMKQEEWLTTGVVSLCGWCLVWVGHLVLPSLWRTKPPAYGIQQNAVPAIDRYLFVGLLLLSFLVVTTAVRFAVDPSIVKWLAIAILAQVLYFAGLARRLAVQGQTAVGVSLTVLPGVLVLALAAGVAVAVYLHCVSWIASGVIGYVGCLGISLFQIIRSFPKAVPPPDAPPEYRAPSIALVLLTGAMLTSLGLALYLRELSALKAALLVILGGLTLWFAWMFVSSVEREGPPQVDTNWGGLGGGLGGWRCSASLVYGLCALTFGICTGFAFLDLSQPNSSVGTSNSTKNVEPNRQQTAAKKNDSASAQPSEATPSSTGKGDSAAEPETK